ncbi:unnamed protein product [Moneuplotes crassus]|uniref:UmuC domain-containing protein n=1 Tax=Euplotes crassus TaxID=5936 RepID=A0AAD1XBE9_EUPCR|nr:unnamed protein product [Moneuplotes crassus]
MDSDNEDFNVKDLQGQYVSADFSKKTLNSEQKNGAQDSEVAKLDQLNPIGKTEEEIRTERVESLIAKASEGMEYYRVQQKREEATKKRLENYKLKIQEAQADEKVMEESSEKAEEKIREFRKEIDTSRVWLHAHIDWFYASIEERENPDLKNKPFGIGDRNVINNVNKLAADLGIRKGIPSFVGKKLCPLFVMIQQDMVKYRKISGYFSNICKEYDPNPESSNLDEYSLDITDYLKKYNLKGDMGKSFIAHRIQKSVKEKLGFNIKIGIGPNILMAKVNSLFHQRRPDSNSFKCERSNKCLHDRRLCKKPSWSW